MPYDHNGDRVTPEDVLDREELADYYASRKRHPRRSQRPVHEKPAWRTDPFWFEDHPEQDPWAS